MQKLKQFILECPETNGQLPIGTMVDYDPNYVILMGKEVCHGRRL
ncbi:hypothetical protein [Sphingobacterium faecium]|nr:hypothetical protein [Sphingobacterium faecium]PTX11041.1 hypothetical protein C8N37_104322 [Sphingobacterium faecium]